jgi:hypothetical protein
MPPAQKAFHTASILLLISPVIISVGVLDVSSRFGDDFTSAYRNAMSPPNLCPAQPEIVDYRPTMFVNPVADPAAMPCMVHVAATSAPT